MQNCNSVSTPTEVGLKLVQNPEGKANDHTLYKQLVGSFDVFYSYKDKCYACCKFNK